MPEQTNTNLKVLIANSDVGATETTLQAFKDSAANGEVIAVESDGTAIASGSTAIKILVKNDSGELKTSEVINVSEIKRVVAKPYSTDQEQISYVGFNGTSGAIDVIANNLYQINLEFNNYNALSSVNRYRKQGHFDSNSSSTQLEIAEGLRDSLIRNFSREPESQRMTFEMVVSTTNDASLGTAVGNVVFTHGSKVVSADDVDDATTNSAIAVGDLLRVGTTSTDAVYRVTAIDAVANTLTLDRTYEGVTQTIADTGLALVPSASVAAQSFGVKLSGKVKEFTLGKVDFTKLRFVVSLVDFGATDVTLGQAAKEGSGVGKRVAEAEEFALGNFGEMYRMGEPYLYDWRSQLNADVTKKYDLVSIAYRETTHAGLQDNPIRRVLDVYCNAGAAGTDHTNANVLITDLNTLSSVTVSTL